MKIKLRKGHKTHAELRRLRALYVRAFPAEERAPFAMLALKNARSDVDFWSIYADSEWAGMLYIVNLRDMSYVFYFAVDEKMRGRGIGSAAVKAAMRYYKDRRFYLAIERLETDAPNYTERVDRRRFYLRCGLEPLGSRVREGSVVYDLIGMGGSISNEEYCELMRNYVGFPMSIMIPFELVECED